MSGRVLRFDATAHHEVDALLPWFVNRTLEGDELEFVRHHVQQCGRCQREVEWLREVQAACMTSEAASDVAHALDDLRDRLSEPGPQRGLTSRLRSIWAATRPWTRWAIFAELAVILALGFLLAPGSDSPALYRTLGAANGSARAPGALVVMFDPGTTEAELQRIVRGVGARVVDGPTQSDAYVLQLPAERQAAALEALRAQRAVVLVERLGPESSR